MAKKYHLTPNGPRKCTAKKGRCPYIAEDHFETNDNMFNVDYYEFNKKRETERYREKFRSLFNEDLGVFETLESGGKNPMRRIGEIIENKRNNDEPVNFVNIFHSLRFHNSKKDFKDQTEVTMMRSFHDDEEKQMIYPQWTFKLYHTTYSGEKIEQKLDFIIRKPIDYSIMESKVHEWCWLAASKEYSGDELDDKQEEMFAQIWSQVRATEVENRSEADAVQHGMSYFKKEGPNKLTANVNYNSTFTTAHVARKLSDQEYWSVVPDFDIRVYDDESNSSDNFWAVKYRDDKFHVTLGVMKNGERIRNDYEVNSGKEAREILEKFISEEMPSNDINTVKEKGVFVENFVDKLKLIKQNHTQNVMNITGDKTIIKDTPEQKKSNTVDNELYDKDNEIKNNTVMGKLFKLFN